MEYPAGTYIVSLAQPCSETIALLLEPESDDSVLAWNRLNTITTDGKVREGWVLANLARKMMENPETADAFHRRAVEDPQFLEDERAKLQFFWEHSAYPTPGVGDYPITRALARPPAAAETVVRRH
jgi:hypothetical protein